MKKNIALLCAALILLSLLASILSIAFSQPITTVYDNCDTLTSHSWTLQGDASKNISPQIDTTTKSEGAGSVEAAPLSGFGLYIIISGSTQDVSATPYLSFDFYATRALHIGLSIYDGTHFYGYGSKLAAANNFQKLEFNLQNPTGSTDPNGLTPNLAQLKQVSISINDGSIGGHTFNIDNMQLSSEPQTETTPTPEPTTTPVPTPTPTGYLPWQKYALNPVLEPSGAETDVGFCSVVEDAGLYHMFYSARTPDWRIKYAASEDGFSWVKHETPVIPGYAYCPIVWKENETWQMIYTGDTYGGKVGYYATSNNAVNWVIQNGGEPVLMGTAGTWDERDAEVWGIQKVGDTYYLWYDTLWHDPRSTGVATSTDLVHWTKDPNNPIFVDTTRHMYCGSPFKYGEYYYFLITFNYQITLFKSTVPTFYPENRTEMGIAIPKSSPYTLWDGNLLDTPFVLTEDVTRTLSANEPVWCYYTGANYGTTNEEVTAKIGLTIENTPEEALGITEPQPTPSPTPTPMPTPTPQPMTAEEWQQFYAWLKTQQPPEPTDIWSEYLNAKLILWQTNNGFLEAS